MTRVLTTLRQFRLRHLLLLLLAVFGGLPVAVTTVANLGINRDLVEREEQLSLSRQVEHMSVVLAERLDAVTQQLTLLGAGWESLGDGSAREEFLREALGTAPAGLRLRIVDAASGKAYQPELDPAILAAAEAARLGQETYRLARGRDEAPAVVVSQFRGGEGATVAFQAIVPFNVPVEPGQELFLLSRETGEVLWAAHSQADLIWDAVSSSPEINELLQHVDFAYSVFEYDMRVGASKRAMLGRIGKIGDSPWALLMQRPKQAAFAVYRRLVDNAILVSAGMVLLALIFAAFASGQVSRPIQQLADTSREIASGNFGRRVGVGGPGREFAELSESFNTMSEHVESQVRRLRRAAQVNRELFLSTLRVMLAAIEAKEPYTAGHSERVASYSRAIASELVRAGTPVEGLEEQCWTAGLLHDIGKIGIEDRILNKGDVLTKAEFEEMKRHPVVGAEILAPVEALRPILPAIRCHHERWAGGGYPDGISGEDIPLLARIVAIADTFDALTTQRVYQSPYSLDEALGIVRKLSGEGFDPKIAEAFFAAYEEGSIRAPAEAAPHALHPIPGRTAVHT